MSTVQPTDKVLVNRAGTDYSATADTLMATIQDTDLLLVNRAGVDYKCSGLDFKAAMVPPESVDKPSLTSPSAGATDVGKTPTFTSSAFSGQNGATHVSTDWQVTTKADTGFAAIVQQSMADTTNKVSWKSGDLAADTDYIARVRYHSAGAVSAWSNVVGFKTKSGFIATLPPSDLATYNGGTTTLIAGPAKLINGASCAVGCFAFGVDNKLYKVTGSAMTQTGDFNAHLGAGGVIAQGALGYNGSIGVINSLGDLYFFNNNVFEPDPTKPLQGIAGAKADLICASTYTSDVLLALSTSLQKVYIGYPTAGAAIKLDGTTLPAWTTPGWADQTASFAYLFTQHPSAPPVQVLTRLNTSGSDYLNAGVSCVLYGDGAMYIKKVKVAFPAGVTKWLQVSPSQGAGSALVAWALGDNNTVYSLDESGTATSVATNALTTIIGYHGKDAQAYIDVSGAWKTTGAWPPTLPNVPLPFDRSILNGLIPFAAHMAGDTLAHSLVILPQLK